MKAFEYAAPTTVEDAVKLLGAPNSAPLAGGTDLLGRTKDYVTSPDRVVYIKDIKELAGISGDPKAGGLTIGAGTRLSDIVHHAGIRESYPALWQATSEVGSVQIRNMSTVGGNLLQRPAAGTTAPASACSACRTARASSAPETTATTPSS